MHTHTHTVTCNHLEARHAETRAATLKAVSICRTLRTLSRRHPGCVRARRTDSACVHRGRRLKFACMHQSITRITSRSPSRKKSSTNISSSLTQHAPASPSVSLSAHRHSNACTCGTHAVSHRSLPHHTLAFHSMPCTRREAAVRAMTARQARQSRIPAGQASQWEPSEAAKPTEPKPATQRHSALPAAACESGAHAWHLVELRWEYVFAGQVTHIVEPLASAYWPARQG